MKFIIALILAIPLQVFALADSAAPTKIQIPFGNSAGGAYIRTVPVASQIGIQNGAASYTDGFPPLNFVPVGAGGVPPFGQDMNGILNSISSHARWWAAGGPVFYDSAYQTAIGGYPAGACVQSVTTMARIWCSTVDNNTSNPDTSGANWQYPNNAVNAINQSGGTVAATTGSFNGQITSTVSTGTAPFVVSSTTPVANLSIGGNAATATNATGNAVVTGIVSGAAMPKISVYRTSGIGIPSATDTKVPFDAEIFDTTNAFDLVLGRFTPLVAGYYIVDWQVALNNDTAAITNAYSRIKKNGTVLFSNDMTNGTAVQFPMFNGGGIIYMNGSTDYLEIFCYNNGTINQGIRGAAAYTYFTAALLP